MSQENVEVVRQFLAAFVEVDEGLAEPQRLSQFITPDFTASGPPGWPGPREFRGLDEFLRFRAEWMEPYDDWRYDIRRSLTRERTGSWGYFTNAANRVTATRGSTWITASSIRSRRG